MEEARAFVSAVRQAPLRELELTFTIRAEEAFLVLADEMNATLEEHAPKYSYGSSHDQPKTLPRSAKEQYSSISARSGREARK